MGTSTDLVNMKPQYNTPISELTKREILFWARKLQVYPKALFMMSEADLISQIVSAQKREYDEKKRRETYINWIRANHMSTLLRELRLGGGNDEHDIFAVLKKAAKEISNMYAAREAAAAAHNTTDSSCDDSYDSYESQESQEESLAEPSVCCVNQETRRRPGLQRGKDGARIDPYRTPPSAARRLWDVPEVYSPSAVRSPGKSPFQPGPNFVSTMCNPSQQEIYHFDSKLEQLSTRHPCPGLNESVPNCFNATFDPPLYPVPRRRVKGRSNAPCGATFNAGAGGATFNAGAGGATFNAGAGGATFDAGESHHCPPGCQPIPGYFSKKRSRGKSAAAANATYNAGPCAGNATYNAGPCAANATYNADPCAANATYNAGPSAANATYNANPCAANATYNADPCAANATYNADTCTANTTFNAGTCGGNTTYNTAPAFPDNQCTNASYRTAPPSDATFNATYNAPPCTPNKTINRIISAACDTSNASPQRIIQRRPCAPKSSRPRQIPIQPGCSRPPNFLNRKIGARGGASKKYSQSCLRDKAFVSNACGPRVEDSCGMAPLPPSGSPQGPFNVRNIHPRHFAPAVTSSPVGTYGPPSPPCGYFPPGQTPPREAYPDYWPYDKNMNMLPKAYQHIKDYMKENPKTQKSSSCARVSNGTRSSRGSRSASNVNCNDPFSMSTDDYIKHCLGPISDYPPIGDVVFHPPANSCLPCMAECRNKKRTPGCPCECPADLPAICARVKGINYEEPFLKKEEKKEEGGE